jgi:hypothetical protein
VIPLLVLLASCFFNAAASGADRAILESELIFPLDVLHNHSSSLVELSNGYLLTCRYRGSGERTADDVMVMAARKRRGAKEWEKPFVLADTPGFPDTNPVLFVDSKQRLWLMWTLVVANRWETSLLEYRIVDSFAANHLSIEP